MGFDGMESDISLNSAMGFSAAGKPRPSYAKLHVELRGRSSWGQDPGGLRLRPRRKGMRITLAERRAPTSTLNRPGRGSDAASVFPAAPTGLPCEAAK